jgi:hypothetical protein
MVVRDDPVVGAPGSGLIVQRGASQPL